jgi:ribosome-binding factor A
VARTIQGELSSLIRELADPRIAAAGLPSITHVDVNVDCTVADVYISLIGGDEAALEAAVAALAGAAPRLRGPVGRRLHLRVAPELRFHGDRSVEFAARLTEIIRDDERRSVSDEPDSDPEES